jgi:hypothetical protein
MVTTYSVEFFDSYETNFVLPNDVIFSIDTLRDSIVPIERKGDKKIKKSVSDGNWETMRTFKATKIKSEDKENNDLRNILNKMSKTNLTENIEKVKTILSSQDETELKKSVELILQICCSNNFFTELYAKLYVAINSMSPLFEERIIGHYESYTSNLKNIVYVDPNGDYDAYCKYNKNNDLQKSTLLFFIHLHKENCFDNIEKIEEFLFALINNTILYENKKNEVEEQVENLFIYFSNNQDRIVYNKNNIENICVKTDEKKSLSSRAKFRCMDIIDLIKV